MTAVTFGSGPEDFQQAEWLSLLMGAKWRFDFATGKWHEWTGVRWSADDQNQVLLAVASLAARSLDPLDPSIPQPQGEVERKARQKLQSIPGAKRALEALATFPGYGTDGSDWDSDPYLMGCENGILDLRKNALVPNPTPDMLVTQTTGHVFEPIKSYEDAQRRAPVFMRVLQEWTSGDVELAGFYLDWFGAGMFGFTPEQRFLLMTGRGRNGKGALKSAILAALGDAYAGEPSANLYMKAAYGAARSDQARADLIALKGKRITFFSDPQGHKFDEELLKAHTGGDRITARALHSNVMQSWEPTHSVNFLLNDAPELEDLGPSMAGRIMVADFREDYSENPDKHLYGSKDAKLNREAPGVLAILAQAAASWYAKWESGQGLTLPKRVIEQSKAFMERNDVINAWLSERGKLGKDFRCPSQHAYESYVNWHSRSGEEGEPMSMVRWSLAVAKKGFHKTKTETGMVWNGFKLLSAMDLADKGVDEDEEP